MNEPLYYLAQNVSKYGNLLNLITPHFTVSYLKGMNVSVAKRNLTNLQIHGFVGCRV